MVKKFASDARSNFADIVFTISRSYDKADEVKFRRQTMIFLFGMGTIYSIYNRQIRCILFFANTC
ncbi:MAG: hypothetical protein PF689_11120 [Deltaproteobacteria bacterium]|nr:hypothetical protein [Deltaproteobacteria bacterium]